MGDIVKAIETWEESSKNLPEYEKTLTEKVKMGIITSMCPTKLVEHIQDNNDLATYTAVKQDIIRKADTHAINNMKPTPMDVDELGYDALALKGKGKGDFGKGVKGKGGKDWMTKGLGDEPKGQWGAPWKGAFKGAWWSTMGKDGNGKDGKGKDATTDGGKPGPPGIFQGCCSNCGLWGHTARLCPYIKGGGRSVHWCSAEQNSGDDQQQQNQEDQESADWGNWGGEDENAKDSSEKEAEFEIGELEVEHKKVVEFALRGT